MMIRQDASHTESVGRGECRRRFGTLAAWVLALFAAASGSAQVNPVYVDDSPLAREMFARAMDHAEENTGEAVRLLQELLDEYAGTVLLVSHDRDFLDRVATTTIAMEGDGRATVYAGGWSDYRAQRGAGATGGTAEKKGGKSTPKTAEAKRGNPPLKLSFTEAHRLEELPAQIARLEAEIAKLEGLLADPDLYSREPVKFRRATEALEARQAALAAAEEEWLTLAEKAEAAG